MKRLLGLNICICILVTFLFELLDGSNMIPSQYRLGIAKDTVKCLTPEERKIMIEEFDFASLDADKEKIKEILRNDFKDYKDKNIEKAIKEGVENFLDNTELKKYSLDSGAYAEYEYLNNFVLITTEILEDGYILSDIHIDVNMIVNCLI